MFAACARFDTAVEINCRPERLDPPDELLELALDVGLQGLDRHRRPRPRPARVAALRLRQGGRSTGSTLDRIVNTWAADDLLAWAAVAPAG